MVLDKLYDNAAETLRLHPLSAIIINPIYVAMLITFIVMLVVLIVYDTNRLVKTSFYIFGAVLSVVFMHNKTIISELKEKQANNITASLVETIDGGADLDLKYLMQ